MKEKVEPNISKEVLDEYFIKMEEKRKLVEEISAMSKVIKHEMAKVGRKEIHMYGYSIDIETKFEPNAEFFELIFKNKLECLLTLGITGNNLKSARRRMGIMEDEYREKYVKEKDTKWLYVKKTD
ncbi:MAG: hypothetical protein ACRC1P_09930 [Cellulosilyticaceae bacterium]